MHGILQPSSFLRPRVASPIRIVIALLLALCLAFGGGTQARAETSDINAAARSVVRVVIVLRDKSGYDVIGHGTGFAVTPKLIVTNAHVLAPLLDDDRLRLGVVPAQGRSGYFARIVRVAKGVDLALIELTEDASLPPATLYTGNVGDGSDVYAVGYPANVDQALGLGLGGLVSPQAPVKTRGQVSGGRTSAQYDTILHTAPIGVGNSGGPLLDNCGRVVGVNSFGTVSDNGSDSEFYFAVSMRELAPFLRNAGVKARYNTLACRSLADFDAQQDARSLRENAARQARQAAIAAERRIKAERAGRRAELMAIDMRETHIALGGLLLAIAVLSVVAAFQFYDRERREQGTAGIIIAVLCVFAAIASWLTRPSVSDIEKDGREAEQKVLASGAESPTVSPEFDRGRFLCRLVPEQSRVTVSEPRDVSVDWEPDGCVNGRTQYGYSSDEWWRIAIPQNDQAIVVNRYDPKNRILTTDRYLIDLDILDRARTLRSQYQAPACGAGREAATALAEQQQSIRELLPEIPNERLFYHCEPAEVTPSKTGLPTSDTQSSAGSDGQNPE